MAFLPGNKLGGRQKGTPNKKLSIPAVQRMIEADFDPFVELLKIVQADSTSIDLKVKICTELAQYAAPKRKSVDMSSEDGTVASGVHEIVVRVVKPAPHEEEPVVIASDTAPNITRLSH